MKLTLTQTQTVDSDSVDIFESKLDRVWSREPMKYNLDEDKLDHLSLAHAEWARFRSDRRDITLKSEVDL